jgi:lipopolysaccharide cholinephosphotransferase
VLGAVRHGGPIPWDYDVDITVPLPELAHFCDVLEEEFVDTPYRVVRPGDKSVPNNITTFPRVTMKKINPRKMHIDIFPQIGITSDPEEQVRFTQKLTEVKTLYRDKQVAYTNTGEWWKRLGKLAMRVKLASVDADKTLETFRQLCATYPHGEAEYVTNPCGKYGTKNIVLKSWFGTPRRIPYLDMLLPVPEHTEEYLTHYYKDYMKYPPQEEIDKMMQYTVTLED